MLILLTFMVGRVGFICYNHALAHFSTVEALKACLHGLRDHDYAVTLGMLAVPALLTLAGRRWSGLPLRGLLVPYYVVLGIVVGIITVVDAAMYEFWQFKLHSVVLSYAMSPEGATSSVSPSFILIRVSAIVGLSALLAAGCIWFTPRRVPASRQARLWSWLILALCALSVPFTRVGDAYYSPKIFLNHAATNPVLAFFSSFSYGQTYGQRYDYLSQEQCDSTLATLYPANTEDTCDTLLSAKRPHILLLTLESFGGKFVRELGGLPEVAPQLSRLIPEGVFWEQYYSNSFRTDRGTVSTLTGHVAHPDVSLMRETELHPMLQSLPRSLAAKGYQTAFLYAGPMTNMGKRQFLEDISFDRLVDNTAFKPEEIATAWGAHDEVAFGKVYELVAQADSLHPLFLVCQTISSHEPWIVPYHRFSDEKLNAFAYTDHCVGQLIDSLRQLPQWKDLLVIIIPDHGFLYQQNYQDPEFFHSPMLWLGGAVREPRRMKVLMNQSDVAATLLGQLRIDHTGYRWSRNVLSPFYNYPFVYCNYPAGIMLKDSTGVSIFDLTANRVTLNRGKGGNLRITKAKVILQESYRQLDEAVRRAHKTCK